MDLSVQILGWAVGEERIRMESDTKSVSLGDYLKDGRIKSVKKPESNISFETTYEEYFINELVRGHYDSDGYKNSIIQIAIYYIQRTGHSLNCYIVKSTDETKA